MNKSIFGVAGLSIVSKGFTFILGVVLVRLVTVEEFGRYSFLISVITIASIPITAGLPNLLIREIASYQLKNKISETVGIIRWSNYYVYILSIISVFCIAFYFFVTKEIDSNIVILLSIISIIPLKGINSNNCAILSGLRTPVLSIIFSQFTFPVLSVFICAILYYTKAFNFNLSVLLAVNLISILICTLASSIIVKIKKTSIGYNNVKPTFKSRKWIKSLVPFSAIAIITTLNLEITILLIGSFGNIEDLAYFKVAAQLMLVVSLGLNAINLVIKPHIARAHSSGSISETQKLLTYSVRLSCAISFPVILTLVVFGEYIVTLIYGQEYFVSSVIVNILIIGQAINVLTGSVGLVLNMMGEEGNVLRSTLLILVINLTLLSITIPTMGIIGAAISVVICEIIYSVKLTLYLRKKTQLKSWLH